MAKHFVIVESPTKAKTIGAMLGKEYVVESSFGHIRDLPKSELGVDVDNDFAPKYVIPRDKSKRVTALKKLAAGADDVYFATDEDREGEAISWHLQEILKVPAKKAKRIVFHEITEEAIHAALEHPRTIDNNLVDAQQARRILDRLVGYKLSPLLWRKVAKGLSAGRVQSVALRLIVEREREIEAFKAEEYWTIEAEFTTEKSATPVMAKLHSVDGAVLDKFAIIDVAEAMRFAELLQGAQFTVLNTEEKEAKRSAPAPFTTSTLQQDANRRMRLSPKQTMMLAQQLYEGINIGGKGSTGLITYMRTDSVNLAEKFLAEAQEYITKEIGPNYTDGPRKHATKSKNAQEAHEAIRPTSAWNTPEKVRPHLDDQQFRLYDLIWRRTMGSQMLDARVQNTTIDIDAKRTGEKSHVLRATGQVTVFDGFTKVYTMDSEENLLPKLAVKDELELTKLDPQQHFTKPPARYSEAGLVKILEEHGIGRPSTYAPTIATLLERNYVTKDDRRLKPTDVALLTNDLLVEHFPEIVNYEFTAHMEDSLDAVASGEKDWVPVLRDFYTPFVANLAKKEQEIKKTNTDEASDEVCDKCGMPMVIKTGRFGKFLSCSGFPDCKNIRSIVSPEEKAENDALMADVEPCEKCGSPMTLKKGRFGKFLACSKYPDCKNIRNLDEKNLGIKCPECGQGDIVTKRAKRGGKIFYGCNRYPDCKYVSWTKPGEEAVAVEK